MLPARKTSLLVDSQQDLLYISNLIATTLDTEESGWTEFVHEFEDELNYLSISATTHSYRDIADVQIEFGIQDTIKRHAIGGLLLHWSKSHQSIKGLIVLMIHGNQCDLSLFVEHLSNYINLSSSMAEAVFPDID